MQQKQKASHVSFTDNKSINEHLQALVRQSAIDAALTNSSKWTQKHNPQQTLALNQWRKAVMFQGLEHIISKRPELDLSNYKTLPCIDLRNICKQSAASCSDSLTELVQSKWTISDEDLKRLSEWSNSHYWLSMVPCFSEGIYRIADTKYIRWSLDHMDIERNLIQVKIDSFSIDPDSKPLLQHHVESSIIFGPDIDDITILTNRKKNTALGEMMQLLNPYAVKQWNDADVSQWKFMEKNVLNACALAKAQGNSITDTENYYKVTENLLVYTSITNAAMANTRYAAKETSTSSLNEDTAISTRPDKYKPTMKTFEIGHIIIKSYTDSPEPIEWTNVEYRTPSWMVRGHIRRLKSGKTCFVQSHENHRHNIPVDNCPIPAASPNIRITGGNTE